MDVSAQPAKIPKDTLLVTTWALTGASVAFFCSRLAIRVKFTGRLWIDDYLAAAALCCLLGEAFLITFMADSMYATLELANMGGTLALGSKMVKRENIFKTISHFMKLQFAETILFWTALWLVKASFLAFFHRLTNNLRPYVIAWWCIAIFTGCSYIASMITYPVSCSSFTPIECESEYKVQMSLLSLRLSTALDIVTDVCIIALPMSLAIRVRLPMKTKLALCAIFGLAGLIIIMAIVRIILTNNNIGKRPEVSWLNLWSAVETSTACIVCNLAVFKFLFSGRVSEYGSRPYASAGRKYGNGRSNNADYDSTGRSQTYGRNSTSYIPPPAATRSAHAPHKRGLHTQVTAIPLADRSNDGKWGHGMGDIIVTRDIDQMTADEMSIFDGDDDKKHLPAERSLSPHTSLPIQNPRSPTPNNGFYGQRPRRKSSGSSDFLPPMKPQEKLHYGY